jgi:hypothetical protein
MRPAAERALGLAEFGSWFLVLLRALVVSEWRSMRPAAERALGLAEFSSLRSSVSIVI